MNEIRSIVLNSPEVVGMHGLIIHNYGPERFMVSLHAEVRADRDILYLHEIIDCLERNLDDTLGCESVIHMDPVETENEEVKCIRNMVSDIVGDIDKCLLVDDFRIVKRSEYTNLIFDVLVPCDFKMSTDELDRCIKSAISEYNPSYRVIAEYDNSYV